MGLSAEGKIDRDRRENGLKKKFNRSKQKSEEGQGEMAKKTVNKLIKLKRKSKTGLDETVKKKVIKLKRENKTGLETAKKAANKLSKLKRKSKTGLDETVKKKVNKLERKSKSGLDGTVKKKVIKLKRKNKTEIEGTGKKAVNKLNKLKRKNETGLDGEAKERKKRKTEEHVSPNLDTKTELINKSDGDSGNNGVGARYMNERLSEKNDLERYRLFVFHKHRVFTEEEVLNLHPDVISVRFPEQKRSRWCWAIFASAEKAAKALEELKSKGRKDIIVNRQFRGTEASYMRKKIPMKAKYRNEIKAQLLKFWL